MAGGTKTQFRTVHELTVKRGEDRNGRPKLETIPPGRVLKASDLDEAEVREFQRVGAIRAVTADEADKIKAGEVALEIAAADREFADARAQLEREQADERRELEAKHEAALAKEMQALTQKQAKARAALAEKQAKEREKMADEAPSDPGAGE